MNKLQGNTATLVLSNSYALTILVNNSGDGVYYQYSDENSIHEAEIDYYEDIDNMTGYADDEDGLMQAGFKTDAGQLYFLAQFMRDDF